MMWVYLAFILIRSTAGAGRDCETAAGKTTTCPNVAVMPHFDITKFLNKWYEIVRTPLPPKLTATCVSDEYSVDENGAVTFVHKQYLNFHVTSQLSSFEGSVTQDKNEKAKLTLKIPALNQELPYWILDTDYVSFAVAYRCQNGVQTVWALCRELHPLRTVLHKHYKVLMKNKISLTGLKAVDRENCPQGT